MKDYGLVLSGGGARGAYELGVLRALKERNINIKGVVGTSIGAVNAAFIAAGKVDVLNELWEILDISSIINSEEEIASVCQNMNFGELFLTTLKNTLFSKGVDFSPFKDLLLKYISEEEIRNSSLDFGLVTFRVNDFKPMCLFKEDIKEGQLLDYVVASACFPLFKPYSIGDGRYIDGGVHDNMPYTLLIDKNYKNLIIVDICGGKGLEKKNITENTIYIKNNHESNLSVLDFSKDRVISDSDYGYKDTLRAFGDYKGNLYYINKDSTVNAERVSLKEIDDYFNLDFKRNNIKEEKHIMFKLIKGSAQISGNFEEQRLITSLSELVAKNLNIDDTKIYSEDELNRLILERIKEEKEKEEYREYLEEIKSILKLKSLREFNKKIAGITSGKYFILTDFHEFESDRKYNILRYSAVNDTKCCIMNMYINLYLNKLKID